MVLILMLLACRFLLILLVCRLVHSCRRVAAHLTASLLRHLLILGKGHPLRA